MNWRKNSKKFMKRVQKNNKTALRALSTFSIVQWKLILVYKNMEKCYINSGSCFTIKKLKEKNLSIHS